MDAAQADPSIHYIVTMGHRPAYSSGYHPGESDLQSYLDQLGDAHSKYVLDLSGHSHDYERTYPQHGVTHVSVGIGGCDLEESSGSCLWPGGCPPPAWSAYRAFHHGTLQLEFSSSGIQADAICGPPGDAGANKNDITCNPGETFDTFHIGTPTSVGWPLEHPSAVSLEEIRPNPSVARATVTFRLADAGPAELELVDVAGRLVTERAVGALGPGPHSLELQRAGLQPGVYWLRLMQDGTEAARRLTLLR
jgi:hypothetical protein